MYDAWPRLYGEVNVDDLIAISALRTGAPSAFTFFCERYSLFEQASKPPDANLHHEGKTKIKDDLIAEWRHICSQNQFDSRAAAGLFKELFPLSGVVTGLSVVHMHRIERSR
jgi:hypothetical protein